MSGLNNGSSGLFSGASGLIIATTAGSGLTNDWPGLGGGGDGGNIIPDAFSFTAVSSAIFSTVYASSSATITGITAASPITVASGEYRINGGAWTSAAGSVVNNDTVEARGTSSASGNTAVNVVVTVGGVNGTFTITTLVNSETSAYLARWGSQPVQARRADYDTFFGALKLGATSGTNIYAKLDGIYVTAGPDTATALLNLKGTSYPLTVNGTPTFTADRGYVGNVSTDFLDTAYTHGTGGAGPGNFGQDSNSLGVYINVAGTGTFIAGSSGSTNIRWNPSNGANGQGRTYSSGGTTVASAVRTGFTGQTRTSSSNIAGFSASAYTTGTSTSAAVVTGTVRFLACAGGAATDRVAFGFFGGGLVAAETTDISNAVSTLLTAIGAN